MSQLALPGPDNESAREREPLSAPQSSSAGNAGGNRTQDRQGGRRRRRRSAASGRFTREDILDRLQSLLGMVAAGWLTPAQANAIARILQMMLQSLEQGAPQRGGASVPPEILADLARRDPAILDVLEPFLTDEQYNSILDEHLKEEPGAAERECEPPKCEDESL